MYQLDNIKKLPPLEYLRSFVVFVESENIVRAAEALNISQPLLSLHLKRLEEHLGTVLFDFVGKKKSLNEAGKALYPLLHEHLNSLSIDLNLAVLNQSHHKRLRIGARKEILDGFISQIDFDGSLVFVPMSSQEIEVSMKKRELDIAISQGLIDSDSVIRKKLWSDQMMLFWSRKFKISEDQRSEKVLAALQDQICYHYGSRSPLEDLLNNHKISLQKLKYVEFPDWQKLISLCEEKSGWGIAPSRYLESSQNKLHTKKLSEFDERTEFYLYYQKDLSKFSWAKDFVAQMLSLKT
ncbi:MAG TPA: LysR family transcriptional regulator [Bdellovibrio sp.]|uniref:LysR family transcriptional regulator n=1 Tax=Bdellovibrio sp. TaxID=28201 RepID=UPI002EE3093E